MLPASSSDAASLRLAAVSFLNTLPLIQGLEGDPAVELVRAVPSALAERLLAGAADAALIPVADLARSAGTLQRVSDACIASDGRTLTVRVFSKVPPERMELLHADTDSHTSVALAGLLWKHLFGRPLRIEPLRPAVELRECESVLLIGDKVVTTPMPWFDHHVDLGDAWKRWTGLPFVFAVWACPRGLARADAIAARLERAREAGVARAAELAAQAGPAHGWPVKLAIEYLTRRLMYTITDEALAGMNRFLELLAGSGIAPRARELIA